MKTALMALTMIAMAGSVTCLSTLKPYSNLLVGEGESTRPPKGMMCIIPAKIRMKKIP